MFSQKINHSHLSKFYDSTEFCRQNCTEERFDKSQPIIS